MNPRLKASRAAIELIKSFEGFRAVSAQLADGRWTIGYGHTKTARPGVQITEADAEALLLYDLIEVQAAVNEAVFSPLEQNPFDALVAFAFNVGLDNFRRSSVLRRINEGNLVQAACALEMWRKADLDGERLVVDALVRRRSAEKTLFLTPPGGHWVPAPSPMVRPRVDYDVAAALPRTSAEVSAPLHGVRAVAGRLGSAPEGGSAVAAAAEAVAERLRSLNLAEADAGIDLEPPPPPAPEDPEIAAPAPVAGPEPALADAGFRLTAPPEPLPAPPALEPELAAAAADEPDEPGLFGDARLDLPSHIANPDTARRIVRRETPLEMDDDPFADKAARLNGIPLLVLGLTGLAVFAGSVFWGINAKGAGGVLNPIVVASILGVIGILLVAGAVYFLLVNLSGRNEDR